MAASGAENPTSFGWKLYRDWMDMLLAQRQTAIQQDGILKDRIDAEQQALDFISFGQSLGRSSASRSSEPTAAPPLAKPRLPETGNEAEPALILDRALAEATRIVDQRRQELKTAEEQFRLAENIASLTASDLLVTRNAVAQTELFHEGFQKQLSQLETLATGTPDNALPQEFQPYRLQLKQLIGSTQGYLEQQQAIKQGLEARLQKNETLRIPLQQVVIKAQERLIDAGQYMEFLNSPIAPYRIERWLIHFAPRLLVSGAVLLLLWFLTRHFAKRLLNGLIGKHRYSSSEEREERIETLSRVLQSSITIVVILLAGLILLSSFGVDLSVILGSAAVFSVAIAFGAQSLIKDYFSGFMILTENQYRVGNVVRINDLSGTVEDINLRITVLRDLEGVAHFIPHSQITTVSNLTHGWACVVLDIGVAYKENVDNVMAVLMQIADELRHEPRFGIWITGDAEMLGVNSFEDSAVMIRLLIKTRPLKQWMIKREMLRRIKNRFDELGIEIPFPHRTVFHHHNQSGPPDAQSASI
jgi:moderate conductance mechanosensitive channel